MSEDVMCVQSLSWLQSYKSTVHNTRVTLKCNGWGGVLLRSGCTNLCMSLSMFNVCVGWTWIDDVMPMYGLRCMAW